MGVGTRLLLAAVVLVLGSSRASARTLETRDEAFARLFPADAVIDRRTEFLSDEQMQRVQKTARAALPHARITFYVISVGDSLVGRAYLDTHPVRSMQETLLIVLSNEGRMQSVDVLAFHEPEDYLPTPAWYRRLSQLRRPQQASPGDGVDAVSGATLTVRATCQALRRVFQVDAELFPHAQAVAP